MGVFKGWKVGSLELRASIRGLWAGQECIRDLCGATGRGVFLLADGATERLVRRPNDIEYTTWYALLSLYDHFSDRVIYTFEAVISLWEVFLCLVGV